jgi:hypothetical protein
MPINIPQQFEQPLADLMALEPSVRKSLEEQLARTRGVLSPDKLAAVVSTAAKLDVGPISRIIRMLLSLYTAREDKAASELAGEICDAAQALGNEKLKPKDGNWEGFRTQLTSLLSLDDSLGIVSKALNVMREHAHVYCTARVLTDVRPIFKQKISDAPNAVIIHTLRVSFHEGDRHETSDFFVAMDTQDLRELRTIIDLAIQKEVVLKSVIARSEMEHLEVESE